MLPEERRIVRNPTDGSLLWVEDCAKIAEYTLDFSLDADLPYRHIPFGETVRKTDLERALELGLGNTPDRERYLRTLLWWSINDKVRYSSARLVPSQEFMSNLLRLVRLYDATSDEHLISAEVYRELGQFEKSLEMLQTASVPENKERIAEMIRTAALARDPAVLEISKCRPGSHVDTKIILECECCVDLHEGQIGTPLRAVTKWNDEVLLGNEYPRCVQFRHGKYELALEEDGRIKTIWIQLDQGGRYRNYGPQVTLDEVVRDYGTPSLSNQWGVRYDTPKHSIHFQLADDRRFIRMVTVMVPFVG